METATVCYIQLFWYPASNARVPTDVAQVIRAYAGKQKETVRVMMWLEFLAFD